MAQSFFFHKRSITVPLTCFREGCDNILPESDGIIDGHGAEFYYCSKYCEDLSNDQLLKEFESGGIDIPTDIE